MRRFLLCLIIAGSNNLSGETGYLFKGHLLDAASGEPVPARVYLQSVEDGKWLFVESASPEGSALPYQEEWVPMPDSVEKHTTISAHPFQIRLEPGRYTLTIERGKEYVPLSETIEMIDSDVEKTLRLQRWTHLSGRGWYSGETHVHRRLHELPNVMLAEDLNVAFPVTFWTTEAFASPDLRPSTLRRQGPSPFGDREDRGAQRIDVDATHVIFPRNTEYEVFGVDGKRHVLGALFILNHQSVLKEGMPPVSQIAEQAHSEGALLDLDKHSWPWSLMLVPVAKVDLFELSNNSVWRTNFGFRRASTTPPAYMKVERDERGLTEWGWLNYGFETYYTLLNCGFRLAATAGTASGVHPVPLGHSRVYVHTGREFDSEKWFAGLKAGRSFVTTGPMLFAEVNGEHPGHTFKTNQPAVYEVGITSESRLPIDRIEIVLNGRVWKSLSLGRGFSSAGNGKGGWLASASVKVPIDRTSWLAVRTVQPMPDGRKRFAHTSPWHFKVPDKPLFPRKEETDFLINQVRGEIDRNREVLPPEALAEYEKALEIYESLAQEREHHALNP